MMTSTFDKIYANAQNMNIETSEWFNRAGFFWCQCTEKQLQKMQKNRRRRSGQQQRRRQRQQPETNDE